jgi:quercetin dioxygenase-like cupin family protein
MIHYKIDFDNMVWEQPMDGVKCKKYVAGAKQVRLVEYSREMPPHWCDKGHYGLILEGEFELEFDGITIVYKAGDGVFIPDGEEHKHRARVLTDSVKVIFVEDV